MKENIYASRSFMETFMGSPVLITVTVVAAAVILLFVVSKIMYRKAAPNVAMIVTGPALQKRKPLRQRAVQKQMPSRQRHWQRRKVS